MNSAKAKRAGCSGNGFKMNRTIFFEKFLDFHGGSKCYFKLNDGTSCQGWIEEFADDQVIFTDSGPMFNNNEIQINIFEIDIETLAYFDEILHQWIDYQLNI